MTDLNWKRIIKKIFFYLFLVVAVILIAGTTCLYLFKDRIINQVLTEINTHLAVPANANKIDIDPFSHFPKVAVSFQEVFIPDPLIGVEDTLFYAKKVDLLFSAIEIWEGKNSFEDIYVKDGLVRLRINRRKEANYNIVNASANNKAVELALKSIDLETVRFEWIDDFNSNHYKLDLHDIGAAFFAGTDVLKIEAKGNLWSHFVTTGANTYLKSKSLGINNRITFELANKRLDIHPSAIYINKANFLLGGYFQFAEPMETEISLQAEHTTFSEIYSLLPENVTAPLQQYKSEGDMYFTLLLKGPVNTVQYPSLDIRFGMQNARLFHPEYKAQLEGLYLEGQYALPDLKKASDGTLTLESIKGQLNGNVFKGNLSIQNFKDPDIAFAYSGLLDLNSITEFYPIPDLESASGQINLDISVKGRINDLKKKSTAQRVSTSGEIELMGVQIAHNTLLPIKDLSGNLIFNKNDLAISNLKGIYGNSDFILNGFFRNIISFLLFENQPLGIEADVDSKYLDIDELLSTKGATQGDYGFSISPFLILDFNCSIDRLKFRRFKASSIRGDLKVKKQIAAAKNIKFESIGGLVELSGNVDASLPKATKINANAQLYNIIVDSAFYIFENFDQNFLLNTHLKGNINADVETNFYLSKKLDLIPSSLVADISASIYNGELNNFAPLQGLNKFLDGEELKNLRFSELKNDIHIENQIIYLPKMEVSTNVTSLTVSGTHHFDNTIHYQIITPLKGKKKKDKDEAFGPIAHDNTGRSMLYLKITGTTDNYQVGYDTKAVKNKMTNDIKKEIKELKDAFKNKGIEQEPDIELSDDDYFDWDL